MGQRTLLEESHQSWKLYVGVAIIVLGWWLNRQVPVTGWAKSEALFWSTALLVFAGAIWIGWSIRCPRCSAKWIWIAASRGSPRIFFSGQFGPTECSECGWPDADRR
jgi:hypothetical protein